MLLSHLSFVWVAAGSLCTDLRQPTVRVVVRASLTVLCSVKTREKRKSEHGRDRLGEMPGSACCACERALES